MKHLYSVVLLCLLFGWSANLSAQAPSCFDSYLSPFCSGIAQYPANFDGTGAGSGPQAPVGPNYDCLLLQPNPTYFSITIGSAGNIDFTLMNSANSDIDFILWGPFNGIAAAQAACNTMGQGGASGGVVDCSYSALGVEPVSIPNALPGEVYILMITNFANTATNIFSTQSTGTGGISCPCDIPYTVDTMPAAFGNQGYMTDTSNNVAQFVVCPNQTLGIQVEARATINDTLSLYGPFTSINSVFTNNTVFAFNPNAPAFYDSLTIFTLLTPSNNDIGVSTFNLGMKNDLYTGGLVDSSCFDILNIQVVVPGVRLTDRNTCAGETFQILTDSIPTTTLGSSSYSWSQIAGPAVIISNTSARQPNITIPRWSSTSVADSVVLVVDYNYGGLCPMRDTMVLHFQNVNLNLTASLDSVCAGQASNLTAILSDTLTPSICDDYTATIIPFAPLASTGTNVTTFTALSIFSAEDEGVSAALPIGFNFDFYCNTYNTFYIHTNGFITFDPIPANSGLLGGIPLPDPAIPNNLIALGWQDLDVSLGGSVRYSTVGVAPNRKLVVSFNAIQNWLGGTEVTSQIILSESDNSVEIHTTSNDLGISTIGIENSNGTDAHYHASLVQGQTAGPINNIAYRLAPLVFLPTYSWTPSGSLSSNNIYNPIATPNIATSYVVTVTDGSCAYTDTTRIDIIPSVATPVVVCDSNGLTTLSFSWFDLGLPSGGFYEYSINGGATWVNVGTALAATATGLTNNTTYTILVRANDGSGSACAISPAASTTCTTENPDCFVNPAINVTLTPSASILCNGDSTACINAVITGGSGNPMNLVWSNGVVDIDSICGLPAGTYTLVVTDTFSSSGGPGGNLTIYEQAFDGTHGWTLNIPTGVNGADNNFWTVSSNEAGRPVGTCGTAGGPNRSLHITSVFNPSGGAAYDAGGLCGLLFCPETNMRAESPAFSTVGQSNLTLKFNYIANGDGLIDNASVVYSANGGATWQTLTASIKSPICPSTQGRWTAYSATLPASCNNNPNVKVGINWTNNDDGVGTDPSVAIDSVVVYTVTSGSSLVSCIETANLTITQPTPFVVTVDSSNNPYCNNSGDGAIYITVSGATPAYSYLWYNGATSDDVGGLNDGVHTVTITDANGCNTTYQTTLTSPNAINIAINAVNSNSCDSMPDGSILLTATGGVGALTYAWNNGATTNNLSNIPNGDYVLTVTDQNNCSDTVQITVVPTVVLTVTDATTQPLCFGDSGLVVLTVLGGSGNYSFDWGAASATTTNTASILSGSFVVTITDSNNGCTTSIPVAITAQTQVNIAQDSISNPTCSGSLNGYIALTVTGGVTPYSYSWATSQTTEDLTGLDGGNYSLTVTDDNGCTATYQSILNVPNAINIFGITPNPNSCDGTPDGSIFLQVIGGTGAYTYLWSNNMTTQDITGIPNGDYILTVTDANNCSDTVQVTINPTIFLSSTTVIVDALCNGQNGSATMTVSGGTGNYSFNWGTSSAVTTNAASLPAGMHYVTFTDAGNGCTGRDSVLVLEPQLLTITLNNITNILCGSASNVGAIDINPNGGTPGYSYNWNTSATTQDLAGLTLGTYTVTITDANNCTVSSPFTVTQSAAITVTINSVIANLSCNLQPIGSLAANGVGGTGITYIWSNSETTANIDSLAAGTYSVTVTNSDGCTATANQTINAPVVPTVNAYVSTTNTTSITIPENSPAVTISAGTTGFNYAWTGIADPNTNNPNIANNTAGTTTANPTIAGDYTYIVTVSATTNDTTCTATDTVFITVEAPFTGMPNAFAPNGLGDNKTFKPITLTDEEVTTFRIYNRWGQEVYNGDGTHGNGWDGTYKGVDQPSEAYIYLLVYKKASSSETKTIRGEVMLVR